MINYGIAVLALIAGLVGQPVWVPVFAIVALSTTRSAAIWRSTPAHLLINPVEGFMYSAAGLWFPKVGVPYLVGLGIRAAVG